MSERGAVTVTNTRSGGGYLSNCLNSHPRIIWDAADYWCKKLTGSYSPTTEILNVLINRPACAVSGTKLVWGQIPEIPDNWWIARKPLVVQLLRTNIFRVALSSEAKHAEKSGQGIPYYLEVDNFVNHLNKRRKQNDSISNFCQRLEDRGLSVCRVTYEQIVGGEGREANHIPRETSYRLCKFLGVKSQVLTTFFKKSHKLPANKQIENWEEVREGVISGGYGEYLRDEKHYR